MRNSFLQIVAKDLLNRYGNNLSNIAIVFPNKRASLFMNEFMAKESNIPVWSPTYTTISDLFRSKTKLIVADPIKQVCDLYKSYIEITGRDETLDHFYGWGQILLSDFDDIDKNMADANKVFANLKDIHELDDIDYLSNEQKDILKSFFQNFSDEHISQLKERFLNLWCNLENIYNDFNHRLAEQGLAYEGALYRSVVTNQNTKYNYDKYIFVGFNLLHKVEQQLFLSIKEQGKASFYWDFDKFYLSNHEAGHFINNYLALFPNELNIDDDTIYNNFSFKKDITYIASMTESAQAHYISKWLNENHRIEAGSNTAIVLCDENLLQTILHCIPAEVKDINITTGYPLAQSPISSFIQLLLRLQLYGHVLNTDKFRLSVISKILSHPYSQYISDQCIELYSRLQSSKIYYPRREHMTLDDGLQLLFFDLDMIGNNQNLNLTTWLSKILKYVGKKATKVNDPLTQESIFRMYTIINRLNGLISSGDLDVDKVTLERLMIQLIQNTTIPFTGEPIQGIQIMGVLETRNLDFDHLLILSATDSNMPKGVNDSSLIPYSIRKAYGLTTIEHKVSIYAYYFYRLLQRANDITLTYNKATEDGQTGDMTRFMLQLLVESPHSINQYFLNPNQSVSFSHATTIIKTPNVMNKIKEINTLSPTAINRYFYCPITFYYNVVENLKEPDNPSEEMKDNRTFGLVFHRSAELIYLALTQTHNPIIQSDIDELLKNNVLIERLVDQAFKEEVFKIKAPANNSVPEYNGLQLINRSVIISYIQKLLYIDRQFTPFQIIGLEKKVEKNIEFNWGDNTHKILIKGIIDRLDEITDNEGQRRIRVIDYKTGAPAKKNVAEIEEVFSKCDIQEKHTNYYLQTILYSLIVSHDTTLNKEQLPVSPALIFIQNTNRKDYDPTLLLDKKPIIRATDYESKFIEGFKQTLQEIFNPDIPFIPTEDRQRCVNCVYSQLCKR